MNPGPLRRFVAAAGLIALVPTATHLLLGSLDTADAAVRAGATLLATVTLGRMARWWLAGLASSFERETEQQGERRATDEVPDR